jgi:5-methylcytosine-specific restriction endonuclease McrA
MARLKSLKSRVAPLKGRELQQISSDSWRSDKSSTKRGYGYRWQKARSAYLSKSPLCVICKKSGIFTAAVDLDHIIPHRGDMALFWDQSNWQGLCKSCHSEKTAREDVGFGNRVQ